MTTRRGPHWCSPAEDRQLRRIGLALMIVGAVAVVVACIPDQRLFGPYDFDAALLVAKRATLAILGTAAVVVGWVLRGSGEVR
jgi:uncharacterized protein YjeT (DUF2065 family)